MKRLTQAKNILNNKKKTELRKPIKKNGIFLAKLSKLKELMEYKITYNGSTIDATINTKIETLS